MGNDNRVAGKGGGEGGGGARSEAGGCTGEYLLPLAPMDVLQCGPAEPTLQHLHTREAMEHLPSVPLAALISSSLRTEPTTTPQVLAELGFSIPSSPGTHILGGNGLGKVGWQGQRAPSNPTVLWPRGFPCTQDSVLPPWSRHATRS